jgi:hypothetical protein
MTHAICNSWYSVNKHESQAAIQTTTCVTVNGINDVLNELLCQMLMRILVNQLSVYILCSDLSCSGTLKFPGHLYLLLHVSLQNYETKSLWKISFQHSYIYIFIYISVTLKFMYIVTCCLKAEIMEPEETSIARQRFGKQVSGATDMQATIEKLLGMMFSI